MDDLKYGTRNKRGDWAPTEPAATAPLFTFPPQPLKLLRWLPHYFLPFNVLWAASAVAWWLWVIPDVETMRSLALLDTSSSMATTSRHIASFARNISLTSSGGLVFIIQ